MKGNTQLRQESIKKVLSEIRLNGPISKRELQKLTGFSWGNISSVTTLLMNEKYIMISGKQETYVGRKPEELEININDNYIIGIDFNSEGILAVLCDLKGRAVGEYRAEFDVKTVDYAIEKLYCMIEEILNDNKLKNIYCIALAMQGKIDAENGISVKISAIEGWRNIAICELIKSKFGIDTVMIHDPDCLLYNEKYSGVLSNKENALLLRIDHGIGIAIMLGGSMCNGITGEIDSIAVPVKDGWAVLRNIVKERYVEEEFFKCTSLKKSCDEIAALARSGDVESAQIFKNIGNALGFALNNAISLLNPKTVILYGAFTNYFDLFLPETERFFTQVLNEKMPEIKLSKAGNNAAAVGAALFAADTVIENLRFE